MRLATWGAGNLRLWTSGCWFMGEGAYLMGAKKFYKCTIFFLGWKFGARLLQTPNVNSQLWHIWWNGNDMVLTWRWHDIDMTNMYIQVPLLENVERSNVYMFSHWNLFSQ
jgi:hypothetical protein